MTTRMRATLLVIGAYLWWGFSPVFWRQLDTVAPIDQLAWRVSLGLVCLVGLWTVRRQNPFPALTRDHWLFGLFAAALIAGNWAGFLWAVDNDQTVEAALGYFLMPLLSVALGVVLLGERLRSRQVLALSLGAVGLVWTCVVVGGVPWVAVVLGVSFATYGWARKRGPFDAVDGLTFELTVVAPILIVVLAVRGLGDSAEILGDRSLVTVGLIALTGAITVVPLLLFASAAKQVPLTVVGLLQYINPVLQFLVGWQLFGEEVSTARLFGFAWIWAALAVVVNDEFSRARAYSSDQSIGSSPAAANASLVRENGRLPKKPR